MTFAIPLRKGKGDLARQIYLWLRQSVLSGRLSPSERLPSTRELSESLDVSRTVVVQAYEQLIAEGFFAGRTGSGTYISAGLVSAVRKPSSTPARLRLSRFGESVAANAALIDGPRKTSPGIRYEFAYRSAPVEDFPLQAWQRILFRRARKAPVRQHDYGAPAGSVALREAITSHLRRSRAVNCDATQVIIVSGSQQALDLASRVLLEPGDRVVLENPHYQGARQVFAAAGARLHPVAIDGEGLKTSSLPRSARLAFLTPSHQFPTGVILSLNRRLELLKWAKRTNAVIIEDDYDGEFRYEGQPLESMQGIDSEGRVIYVGTFSRTIFPALRIGYLVAPKSLVSAFTAAKWLTDRHTPTLEQETLAEFIESGAYERHLRRARRQNARRRAVLLESIGQYLGDRVKLTGAGSGTHVVLWPVAQVSEASIISRAAALGVGVHGISKYFLDERPNAGLLLGYTRLREKDIAEGIRLLANVIA